MKVVLDTNVVVSGLLWDGNESKVLELCHKGTIQNFASPAILSEIERVLQYKKFKLVIREIEDLMNLFQDFTRIVKPSQAIGIIENDEPDNRFLECAVAANVDLIVSGDTHLLELQEFQGRRIINAAELLNILESL